MSDGFIPKHGGYQKLLAYQRAEVVYDATVKFCADLMSRRDRTVDQPVIHTASPPDERKRLCLSERSP